MKKQYYMVLDVEAFFDTISEKPPIPYNIAYVIVDIAGNQYLEKNYLIQETYSKVSNKLGYKRQKIYNEGNVKLVSFARFRREFITDYLTYEIAGIYAYNLKHDLDSLDYLAWNLAGYYNFLSKGVNGFCLWNLATNILLNRPSYFKFIEQYDLFTDKGNIPTNAEACTRYLLDNPHFKQAHTALEDAKMEAFILRECYRQKKKILPYRRINTECWRATTNRYTEWALGLR